MINKDPRRRNITQGINGWWFLHFTSYPNLQRKRTRINLWTKDFDEAVRLKNKILPTIQNRSTYKIYQ